MARLDQEIARQDRWSDIIALFTRQKVRFTMQIVIDIPDFKWLENEEDFKEAVKEYEQGTRFDKEIRNVLLNGTPLPKRHGRIIDESKIVSIYYHKEISENELLRHEYIVIDGTDAPTIIEADMAGSEVENATN